jgi:hypothetical protein
MMRKFTFTRFINISKKSFADNFKKGDDNKGFTDKLSEMAGKVTDVLKDAASKIGIKKGTDEASKGKEDYTYNKDINYDTDKINKEGNKPSSNKSARGPGQSDTSFDVNKMGGGTMQGQAGYGESFNDPKGGRTHNTYGQSTTGESLYTSKEQEGEKKNKPSGSKRNMEDLLGGGSSYGSSGIGSSGKTGGTDEYENTGKDHNKRSFTPMGAGSAETVSGSQSKHNYEKGTYNPDKNKDEGKSHIDFKNNSQNKDNK